MIKLLLHLAHINNNSAHYYEYIEKMVREYKMGMAEALKGNLPMEESSLFRIHQQKLDKVENLLRKKTHCINPLHTSDEDIHLHQLQQMIIKESEPNDLGICEVVGGALFQFTIQNYNASNEQCEKVLESA